MSNTQVSIDQNDKKYKMMTGEPVERLICRLALPMVIIMMISGLYNMADTYFVSSLGTSATAAIGIAFSLMAVIQAVGFFFGHGAGNYIARTLGARKIKQAEKMAATGFFTAFGLGLCLSAAGIIFLTPLAHLLGSTETILPYARDYLRFILMGAPFMISSLMLNNMLRYQGNALFGMIGMVSGSILNIVLDPLFIYGFHLGVKGASLATMISQAISFLLLFAVTSLGKGNVRILPNNFSPSLKLYIEILKGGSPSLLRQAFQSIAFVLLNHAAGVYGDAFIASISIVNRIFLMAGSAIIGFGQSFQPVCGFNYGAKFYDRVKKAFWFCMRLSTVLLIILSTICFIFAPWIISLFQKDDAQVLRVGTFMLRIQCLTFPLFGWILMVSFMLQTMGKAFPASILAFSRQGLFLIPLLFTVVPLLGGVGIVFSIPIADFCTFILSLPLGILTLRKDLAVENVK